MAPHSTIETQAGSEKTSDCLRSTSNLILQRMRRRCRFFDQRGVLLRHLIHLTHCAVHLLIPALCSFEAWLISFEDSCSRGAPNSRFDHRCTGVRYERRAFLHRFVDVRSVLDLLRRRRRALCKTAHFAATTQTRVLATGARCFHSPRSAPGCCLKAIRRSTRNVPISSSFR